MNKVEASLVGPPSTPIFFWKALKTRASGTPLIHCRLVLYRTYYANKSITIDHKAFSSERDKNQSEATKKFDKKIYSN